MHCHLLGWMNLWQYTIYKYYVNGKRKSGIFMPLLESFRAYKRTYPKHMGMVVDRKDRICAPSVLQSDSR